MRCKGKKPFSPIKFGRIEMYDPELTLVIGFLCHGVGLSLALCSGAKKPL